MYQKAEHSINLLDYPKTSNITANSEHTVGDLNGSALYLLNFLITKSILTTTDKTYNEFVTIYLNHQNHIDTYKVNPSLQNKLTLVKDAINFLNLFKYIAVNSDAINLKVLARLIGDELCDRGPNDLFTLVILVFLDENNIDYESMFSNHAFYLLVSFYLNDFTSNMTEHFNSTISLHDMIIADTIPADIYEQMFFKIHLRHMKLLSYTQNPLDKNDYIIYTHAPVPTRIIKDLAIYFNMDETEPSKIIDQANAYFLPIINDKDDFLKRAIDFDSKNEYTYYPDDPIFSLIFFRTQHKSTAERLHKFGIYTFSLTHGHDGFGESPDESYIINLDSSLGRPGDYIGVPGYLSTQDPLAMELVANDSDFIPTVYPTQFEELLDRLNFIQKNLENVIEEKARRVDSLIEKVTQFIKNTANCLSLTLNNMELSVQDIPNTPNRNMIYIKIVSKTMDTEFIQLFLNGVHSATNQNITLTIYEQIVSRLEIDSNRVVSLQLSNCVFDQFDASKFISQFPMLLNLSIANTNFQSPHNKLLLNEILDLYTKKAAPLTGLSLSSCLLNPDDLKLISCTSKYISLSRFCIETKEALQHSIENEIINIVKTNRTITTLLLPQLSTQAYNKILQSIKKHNYVIVNLMINGQHVATDAIARNKYLTTSDIAPRLRKLNLAKSHLANGLSHLDTEIDKGNAFDYLETRPLITSKDFNTTNLVAKTPAEKILLLLDFFFTLELGIAKFNEDLITQQHSPLTFNYPKISSKMPEKLMKLLLACLNNIASPPLQTECIHLNAFVILQKANKPIITQEIMSLIFKCSLEQRFSKISLNPSTEEFDVIFKLINDLPEEHYSYIDNVTPLAPQKGKNNLIFSTPLFSAAHLKVLVHKLIDKIHLSNPSLFHELMAMILKMNIRIINMQNKLLLISNCCNYFANQVKQQRKENNDTNSSSTTLTTSAIKKSVAEKLQIHVKLLQKPVVPTHMPNKKSLNKNEQSSSFWNKHLRMGYNEEKMGTETGIALRK